MEILKAGTLPSRSNKTYTGECSWCHCQVKCTSVDALLISQVGGYTVVKVKCPTPKCTECIALQEYVTRD